MRASIKTLEGKLLTVEASSTIVAVRGLISAAHPEMPAAALKLIHSGKVLSDEETLAEKGVAE